MIAFYFGLFVFVVSLAVMLRRKKPKSVLTPGMAAELERLEAMQEKPLALRVQELREQLNSVPAGTVVPCTQDEYEALTSVCADEWIPHDGGECPVPTDSRIDYKLRSGAIYADVAAVRLGWSHIGSLADIIAYRLHKPEQAVKESLITADAFTSRPNWDEAPEWAAWAAQNECGSLAWFQVRPEADEVTFFWKTPFADHIGQNIRPAIICAHGNANPNWKQAIERRPVNIAALEEKWKKENTKAKPGEPLLPRIPTEKDGSELISREELAELRRKGEAYDDLAPMYAELYEAARRYVRNHQSQKNFERLAEAAGEELA